MAERGLGLVRQRRARVVLAAVAGATALAGACAVRLPSEHGNGAAEGLSCTHAMECPAPTDPCLLAYCLEARCVHVPSPAGPLPAEAQRQGDCQHWHCDGNGQAIRQPAPYDLPPDDSNPCTDEVCAGDEPRHPPKAAGQPCADGGVCNGAGICGACLPDKRECRGHAVRQCSAEGQWSKPSPCPTAAPVCAAARCLAVADLGVGAAHACVRFEDGSVRCWGADEAGQLGTEGIAAAEPPSWLPRFVVVDLGWRHACGIDLSGSPWCWGAGDFGQLGQGSYESSDEPVATGVAGARQVAVGRDHSCALTGSGEVLCWGRNDRVQLGTAPQAAGALPAPAARPPAAGGQPSPQPVAELSNAGVLLVGERHTCVGLPPTGLPHCWGEWSFSLPEAIDDPSAVAELGKATGTAPQKVAALPAAAQIALGADFGCARDQAGAVYCWGAGDRGQLGDGSNQDRHGPAAVADLAGAVHLGLGDDFACALLGDGSVRCWGANDHGQLGHGAAGDRPQPTQVVGVAGAEQLAVGASFACARASEGGIWCWGKGAAGQLGSGSTQDAPKPVPVRW